MSIAKAFVPINGDNKTYKIEKTQYFENDNIFFPTYQNRLIDQSGICKMTIRNKVDSSQVLRKGTIVGKLDLTKDKYLTPPVSASREKSQLISALRDRTVRSSAGISRLNI